MALKPTIFKLQLHISNFDDDVYASSQLTLAQHPSETAERLTARIIAYCLNYHEQLVFTSGLSSPDEPDIRQHSLDGRTLHWIDMGEPSVDRIKKACRQTERLSVYSYNTKSDVWWRENSKNFEALSASYFQLDWQQVSELSKIICRTMEWSVSISSGVLNVSANDTQLDIHINTLYQLQ
jgi:uncharacterized protein YaeQ